MGTPYRFCGFTADRDQQTLFRGQRKIGLERKPFQVLIVLLSRPGQIVSKADLIQDVWVGEAVTDYVVTNAISKLRGALDPEAKILETVGNKWQ